MPNLHDIDKRIKSVSSTKQITRTMEMVAGAKVKHATERIAAAAPYSDSMVEMLQGVAERVQPSENPLLEKHESVKRILAVAVVSDRGLAGGFNSNVLRAVEKTVRAKKSEGVEVDIIACGKKAGGFFRFRKMTPVLEFKDQSADPTIEQAGEIADYAIKAYEEGSIDEVVLIYNHSKNLRGSVKCLAELHDVDLSGTKSRSYGRRWICLTSRKLTRDHNLIKLCKILWSKLREKLHRTLASIQRAQLIGRHSI